MPSLAVYAKEFEGYTPAVDSRRMQKPGVIDGTNFIDGIDGPYSAFSNDFWNWALFDATSRAKVTELRVGNLIFYGTPTGVWRVNPTSLNLELLIPITVTNTYWPWTVALVGGLYYFAQYDIGLWQYDATNEVVTHIVTPAGDTVRHVALSYARLMYLTDTVIAWSAVDDGTNLTPSLTTGAGFQALSIAGGTAYSVDGVSDGFIVHTSNGMIKATYVWYANYIFKFEVIGRNDIKAFSPNLSAVVPGIGLIVLDGAGFRATNGGPPQVWEPLMSEYLKLNYIQYLNQGKFGTTFMYYSQALRALFVGFGPPTTEGLITNTFVYYVPSGKWGVFSNSHYGIFEFVQTINSVNALAYMAVDGYMRAFTNTDFTEGPPAAGFVLPDFVFRPSVETIVKNYTDTTPATYDVGYTEFNFSDHIPTAYANFVGVAEQFSINIDKELSDTPALVYGDPAWITGPPAIGGTFCDFISSGGVEIAAIATEQTPIGLNSYVKIGPFRYTAQQQADETSNITSLIVGIANINGFVIFEDYLTENANEDWSVGMPDTFDDWGAGNTNPNNFTFELVDTDDGINPQFQGVDTLLPVLNNGASLSYAPTGYASVYHIMNLRATLAHQSFALKFIDISGQLTGRLL